MTDDDERLDVVKHGVYVQMSREELGDAGSLATAVMKALTAPRPTPEEARAARKRAQAKRAEERAAAVRLPLTLDLIVERMGWSTAYAEHLVQPYCRCGPTGPDGEWEVCEHAEDLGVTQ